MDPVFDGLRQSEKRQRAIALFAERHALPANVRLSIWTLLGEIDRAMEVARQLEETPGYFALELLFIEEFKALRQHADFPAFARAIGLTEYWRNAGCDWTPEAVTCTETGD